MDNNTKNKNFKDLLLEKLKNNFTESEIQQLLINLPEEKNNLILIINKKKQDTI